MSKRVLIAEDEPNIVLTLEFLLGQAGYEVHSAGSGEEALRKLQALPVDLVVLDVMLPDMSGFEVCRRLRDDLRGKDTKVLMLTAKGGSHDVQKGLALGADAYVTKPFGTREFVRTVQGLLSE
jgi:DNA-binding response OmpR family regulator